jgi:hypothetical protein
MRVLWALLVLMWLWPGTLLAGSPPKKSADGSLVLTASQPSAQADTLYELQAREVQAYLSKYRTWIWTRGSRSRTAVWRIPTWRASSFRTLSNPQLESLIFKYANFYGVDPALVRSVMHHESGFNAQALSPKGAQGLMQLMPGTAALMGVSNPFDPEQNVAGGVGYLRYCLERFRHNVPLALAAYNAGPESVSRYGNIPPYAETQLFVRNVMGTYTGQPCRRHLAKVATPRRAGKEDAARRRVLKQAPTRERLAKEAPRPRAKIIEVRPFRGKTRRDRRIIEVRSPKSSWLPPTGKD